LNLPIIQCERDIQLNADVSIQIFLVVCNDARWYCVYQSQ